MNPPPSMFPRDLPAAGPCLDANDVAALSGSSLPADEREAMVVHLGACAACRGWVGAAGAALEAAGPSTEPVPTAGPTPGPILALRGRARWIPFAIAAATLVAIGVGIARSPRLEGPTGPEAEAARIGSRHLTGLEIAALRDRPPGPERGGMAILSPRGTVASPRPDLAWTELPGATSARVTVRDAEGTLRLDATSTTSHLAWPADRPPLPQDARYVVRVLVSTPAGEASGSAAFRVPSATEDELHALLLARIRAEARPAWRALLCAHEAAAEKRWAEADAFLRQAAADGAPAAALTDLRALVDAQLGRPGP